VIDQPVVSEAVQISGETRGDRIARARAHDVRPDILEQVFGRRGVAALAHEIAIERRFVPPVELVESGGVAIAIGDHQVFVAKRLVPWRHGVAVCASTVQR